MNISLSLRIPNHSRDSYVTATPINISRVAHNAALRLSHPTQPLSRRLSQGPEHLHGKARAPAARCWTPAPSRELIRCSLFCLGMASREGLREQFSHLYDDGESFLSTCDMRIVVEGVEVPVHSQALIMHSRFFRRLIMDVKRGEVQMAKGESFHLNLDKSTKVADFELLLGYLYNRHATVDKFSDAIILVTLADKYDMPSIVKICEPVLCEETVNMHFAGYTARQPNGCGHSSSGSISHDIQSFSTLDDSHDAARWLSVAERYDLTDLKVKCQSLILQTLAYTGVGSTDVGYMKLQENRISLKSIFTIAAVLGQCIGDFGRCPCGKMFSSLRCASCLLDNTAQVSRAMCESWLLKYGNEHNKS